MLANKIKRISLANKRLMKKRSEDRIVFLSLGILLGVLVSIVSNYIHSEELLYKIENTFDNVKGKLSRGIRTTDEDLYD